MENASAESFCAAVEHSEIRLKRYDAWEVEDAVTAFRRAVAAEPANPEYQFNLSRAYGREGSDSQRLRALGDYVLDKLFKVAQQIDAVSRPFPDEQGWLGRSVIRRRLTQVLSSLPLVQFLREVYDA